MDDQVKYELRSIFVGISNADCHHRRHSWEASRVPSTCTTGGSKAGVRDRFLNTVESNESNPYAAVDILMQQIERCCNF